MTDSTLEDWPWKSSLLWAWRRQKDDIRDLGSIEVCEGSRGRRECPQPHRDGEDNRSTREGWSWKAACITGYLQDADFMAWHLDGA